MRETSSPPTRPAIGQFDLRRVVAVGGGGVPILEGTNARVVATSRFGPKDVGAIAVCQSVLEVDEEIVVALGIVRDAPPANDAQPLVLRAGGASLELHSDGRIRLVGADVVIDAERRMHLLAARVDLN